MGPKETITVNNSTNCLNPFVRKTKFLFSYYYFFMKRINFYHIAPLAGFFVVVVAISKLGAILFQY